jgi:hypothetical protein
MMDERQIREEAWFEGAEAVRRHSHNPVNPYALVPDVDHTPSDYEIRTALRGTFTADEIDLYQNNRDKYISGLQLKIITNRLELMKGHANAIARLETEPLSTARAKAISDCLANVETMGS